MKRYDPKGEAMAVVNLRAKEVGKLGELLTVTDDVRQLTRAQALLWLDAGDSVEEVAERLGVTRQAVYNWGARFTARTAVGGESRVADGARSGRPRTAFGIIEPLLEQGIETDPRERGYRATLWTAPLLQHYLVQEHQRPGSTKSIQRALARLRMTWKRPRHHLALRARYWRQAKGGLNAAFGSAHER